MERCRGGWIKELLPPNTVAAHKTGKVGATLNDVGIIRLPDGRELVLGIFTKSGRAALNVRERVISEISRTVYDYYVTATGEPVT